MIILVTVNVEQIKTTTLTDNPVVLFKHVSCLELFLSESTQTQQQRPESPTVTLIWHASKYEVHKLHHSYILS